MFLLLFLDGENRENSNLHDLEAKKWEVLANQLVAWGVTTHQQMHDFSSHEQKHRAAWHNII